ncbi:MAG: holo-[acyl-carrier-protein] synthase [Chloroflexus sp.]|uniref:holo-ACP synthase n=1 Tax=Chloroflexus sp. TaxID=1904827 RepID=UPI0021DCA0A7|nr:holo-ACP synthase [Chloroflexus sp.]GIV87555.1 MAG: holo-[acyl-carrier-protein] synthase [Chloroflexus sp.]
MLYHGVDLVEVRRIRQAVMRYGQRFLARVYTAAERADCEIAPQVMRYEALAARWAAKEACAKALGIGLRGLGAFTVDYPRAGLHDIEVVRDAAGRPTLHLSGVAAQTANALQIRALAVSLSHTDELAIASVVAWADLSGV